MKHKTFIIIIGATRSGTTSLYNYLTDHLDVNASMIKMTGFFLNPRYNLGNIPVKEYYALEKEPASYLGHFKNAELNHYLEASPDYLYSENTENLIRDFQIKTGSDLRLICLLRHPTDRFISAYKNAKKLGIISSDKTLKEFYCDQENINPKSIQKGAKLMSKYPVFLSKYRKTFSEEKLLVLPFESLCSNPKETIDKIGNWLGLSVKLMENYSFREHNKSTGIKPTKTQKAYLKLRKHLVSFLIKRPRLLVIFSPFGKLISRRLFSSQKSEKGHKQAEIVEQLDEDFQDFIIQIKEWYPHFREAWK